MTYRYDQVNLYFLCFRRRMQTGHQLGKGNKYRTVWGTILIVYRQEQELDLSIGRHELDQSTGKQELNQSTDRQELNQSTGRQELNQIDGAEITSRYTLQVGRCDTFSTGKQTSLKVCRGEASPTVLQPSRQVSTVARLKAWRGEVSHTVLKSAGKLPSLKVWKGEASHILQPRLHESCQVKSIGKQQSLQVCRGEASHILQASLQVICLV